MTEPARVFRGKIEHDIVRTRGITGNAPDRSQVGVGISRHVIQPQRVAHAPGDIVVRAGGIAADAHAAQNLVRRIIQTQAAAEHIHAANFPSHHGIVELPVPR